MTPSFRRWIRIGVGIAISIACLVFIFSKIDSRALLLALGSFNWPLLGAGIAALGADYTLRIVRWRIMLQAAGTKVSFGRCALAFLGSMALNNLLPLRAGDVVRAMVFPASLGISRATATASLVLERLVDLLALLACLGIGIALARGHQIPDTQQHWITLVSAGGITALIATIALAAPIARLLATLANHQNRQNRLRLSLIASQLSKLLSSLAKMAQLRILGTVGGLSLLIWFGEAGLFLALLHGFGLVATPQAALVIMALATLATLIPSSPGYVGPFHLAAFSAVILYGGNEGQAAGFALLAHLALWVPVTLAGVFSMVVSPDLFRRSSTREEPDA
jgi:glycosyltransferase 2 family protein